MHGSLAVSSDIFDDLDTPHFYANGQVATVLKDVNTRLPTLFGDIDETLTSYVAGLVTDFAATQQHACVSVQVSAGELGKADRKLLAKGDMLPEHGPVLVDTDAELRYSETFHDRDKLRNQMSAVLPHDGDNDIVVTVCGLENMDSRTQIDLILRRLQYMSAVLQMLSNTDLVGTSQALGAAQARQAGIVRQISAVTQKIDKLAQAVKSQTPPAPAAVTEKQMTGISQMLSRETTAIMGDLARLQKDAGLPPAARQFIAAMTSELRAMPQQVMRSLTVAPAAVAVNALPKNATPAVVAVAAPKNEIKNAAPTIAGAEAKAAPRTATVQPAVAKSPLTVALRATDIAAKNTTVPAAFANDTKLAMSPRAASIVPTRSLSVAAMAALRATDPAMQKVLAAQTAAPVVQSLQSRMVSMAQMMPMQMGITAAAQPVQSVRAAVAPVVSQAPVSAAPVQPVSAAPAQQQVSAPQQAAPVAVSNEPAREAPQQNRAPDPVVSTAVAATVAALVVAPVALPAAAMPEAQMVAAVVSAPVVQPVVTQAPPVVIVESRVEQAPVQTVQAPVASSAQSVVQENPKAADVAPVASVPAVDPVKTQPPVEAQVVPQNLPPIEQQIASPETQQTKTPAPEANEAPIKVVESESEAKRIDPAVLPTQKEEKTSTNPIPTNEGKLVVIGGGQPEGEPKKEIIGGPVKDFKENKRCCELGDCAKCPSLAKLNEALYDLKI